jgi:hypothetical protein
MATLSPGPPPKMPPNTIRHHDGVDQYGLYFEFVEHHLGVDGGIGQPTYYNRVFVTGSTIASYRRLAFKKSTVWRISTLPGRESVIDRVERMLKRPRVVMRGEPVYVQLRASDVLAISKGIIPAARYDGQRLLERMLGKWDVASWKDIVKTAWTTGSATVVSAGGGGGGGATVTAIDWSPTDEPSIASSSAFPVEESSTSWTKTDTTTSAIDALIKAAEDAKAGKR